MADESNASCSHLEVSHETAAGGGGHVARKEGRLSDRLNVGQVVIAYLRRVRWDGGPVSEARAGAGAGAVNPKRR